MELGEALYTTRAMRRVKPDPIPREVQARIMDAAIRAPSGGNDQGWRFVLVDDPGMRAELGMLYRAAYERLMQDRYAGAAERIAANKDDPELRSLDKILRSGRYLADHFEDVPLIMFALLRGDTTGLSLYPAVWSAMLAAREHGVGSALTSVLSMYAGKPTSTLLDVPDGQGWRHHCAITFGYPLGRWGVATRKPFTAVTYRNTWGTPSELNPGPYWPA